VHSAATCNARAQLEISGMPVGTLWVITDLKSR
jgi:hypothetical protein